MSFEMKNTMQVQIDSMTAYLGNLGYEFANKGWETNNPSLKHVRRISHRTAIALHNLQETEWVQLERGLFSPLINGRIFDIAMNGYTLSQTQATKLVQKVKMQPNRKIGEGVELQSHMVKPFKPYMTITLGLTE